MKSLKIKSLYLSITLLGMMLCFPVLISAQSQVPAGDYPNATDAKGKQGAWKKLDDKGTCIYVGQFKDDQPYGLFIYFDDAERKMSEMFFINGGAIAYGKVFSVKGKLQAQGKYVNKEKDSLWTFYTEDGVLLSKETYVKGKKEGKSYTYHPQTQKIAEEKSYKNGLEDGPWTTYYSDGKKESEGTYVNGNYEGKAVWYFPDGRINIIGSYLHALKDGNWVYYNPDGTVKGKESWKAGKLTSQEQIIKKEDLNKEIGDPQDPNHDAGGDEPQVPR